MSRRIPVAAALPLLVCLALARGQAREEVFVSAAASLTDVMQPIAAAYEKQSGQRVVLNLAASNTLARQINAGARVDVFVSADEAQMDVVKGHIRPGSRVNLLSNLLAVAVPDDKPLPLRSMRDLTGSAVRRIAVGDPAAVPAGVYARTYLQKIGLWTAIEPKLVPSGSVRLALAAVENGAADAAIVYRTDIRTAKRAREAFVVPREEGPRITYPAAVLTTGRNAAGGTRFLAYLRAADARTRFERAGFLLEP